MTDAHPLRLRAPPGGDANTRAQRGSKPPRYTTLMTAPAGVAHAYFAGVTAHDADAIAACFAEDAELVTNTGTFHGREAIRGFYRDTLLQSDDLRPSPGPFIVDGDRVAVEIDLLRGGRHIARRRLLHHRRRHDQPPRHLLRLRARLGPPALDALPLTPPRRAASRRGRP
jgi:SnoaL-like domain